MNERELKIKQYYEAEGWRMLRGGAPDFIALKVNGEGEIQEFMGVEVKPTNGSLSYEQAIYKRIFQQATIKYIVEVVP